MRSPLPKQVYVRYFVIARKLLAFLMLMLLILHPRLLVELLAVALKATVLSLLQGAHEAAEDTLDYALQQKRKTMASLTGFPRSASQRS